MKPVVFAFLLAALALLCACTAPTPQPEVTAEPVVTPAEPEVQAPAPAEKPEPEQVPEPEPPQWPDTPTESADATGVTVNAQALTVYQQEGQLLLKLDEFARAVGGTILQKRPVEDTVSCVFTAPETKMTFTTADAIYDGSAWYVPQEQLLQSLWLREFQDPERNHVYYTTDRPGSVTPEGYRVPVLMYHAVSDDTWGMSSLFVSPGEMEAQLQYLQDEGFTTLWFEDLPNVAQYEKPILLTFDDGYDDNYTELLPLLEKYQAKATVFVIAERMGTEHKMTEEQVKAMHDSGLVSIQSHTMTHPYLSTLSPEDQEYQMARSQLKLARLTGKVPRTICYPGGWYNQDTMDIAAKYYDFGLIMEGFGYTTGQDPYQVSRYFISRGLDMGSFKYFTEH